MITDPSITPLQDSPTASLSKFAVVSVVTGALLIPLLPTLLGAMALSEIRESNGQMRGRGAAKAGIVLGVLWFVLAALAIFVASRPDLIGPRLSPQKIASNHSLAIDAMRRIVAGEKRSQADDLDGNQMHDYWTEDVAGLYANAVKRLGIADAVNIDIALADEAPWNPDLGPYTPRNGYRFRTIPGVDRLDQFAFSARPVRFGWDGVLTFYVDERGIVWSKNLEGESAQGRIADPAAEGWGQAGQ